jgi:hypothetical protein
MADHRNVMRDMHSNGMTVNDVMDHVMVVGRNRAPDGMMISGVRCDVDMRHGRMDHCWWMRGSGMTAAGMWRLGH